MQQRNNGSYLRPKIHIQHTHSQHLSTRIHATTNNKTLTATGWGKQQEALIATYKAAKRPALEYASSILSHLASSTIINKLQVMQYASLRTATGCTQDTNLQHLHDKTLTLPIHEYLQLHAHNSNRKHIIHNILYTNIQHTSSL